MSWKFTSTDEFDAVENSVIAIKIARLGAELISLKIKKNGEWVGLLVNDDDTDPQHDYWKRHAPFLFPIVGGLQNDTSKTTDGKTISLPSHGFARINTFNMAETGSDSEKAWIEYSLSNPNLDNYPWDCELTIRYTLTDRTLNTEVITKNRSNETMWYQFGWHPGFKAPISGNASDRPKVELTIPNGTYKLKGVDPDCLLTDLDTDLTVTAPLKLSDKELKDTYILDMESVDNRWVSLYDPESDIKTTLTFDQYPHLGLWALPNAPYICLEPWQGCDDYVEQTPFDKKFGIASLEAGQENRRNILTTIEY